MNPIDVTISKTLQRVQRSARELIKQHRTKYSRRQEELAGFFGIEQCRLSDLRTSKESLVRIDFRNAMVCFEPFVLENGRITEEVNYDYFNGERVAPVREKITIGPETFYKILEQASVFFEWHGEKYCMDIAPKRWSDNGSYDLSFTARNQSSLDRLLETFVAYKKKHHYLRGKKFNGGSGDILPLNQHSWEDLVWPDKIKERLRVEVETVFKNASLFSRYGLNSKKGFILAGEPGNGKTLLLKILAKETDATCILVPFDEFRFSPYLFSLARDLSPSVLILEDIDLFGTDRDNASQSVELGKLMNQLDGMVENHEIVVIATTNRLENVEKALQNRPGRFDRIYVIPNPDFRMRIDLIAHFIGRIPNEITKDHIEILAEEFSGYSAAYLKELINSGFAQAILRDGQNPVLQFKDLETMVGILKHKKDKVAVGFSVVQESVKLQSPIQNKKEEYL